MTHPGPRVLLASPRSGFVALRMALLKRLTQSAVDVFETTNPAHIARDVAHADLVLLLVGDDYGEVKPGQRRSRVHQLHALAVEQHVKVVPVLVEGAGALQGDGGAAAWKRSLQRWPDVLVAPRISDTDAVAERVSVHLTSVVARGLDAVVPPPPVVKKRGAVSRELARLIEVVGNGEADVGELGFGPAPLRREDTGFDDGVLAIELGMWREAVEALASVVACRPLDSVAGFWLARVHLHLGSPADHRAAMDLAQRAARVEAAGEGDQCRARAAACWLVAARAARRMGWQRRAELYAGHARGLVPWRVEPIIEEATDAARQGDWDGSTSKTLEAFLRHPSALARVLSSEAYAEAEEARTHLLERVTRQVASLARVVCEASRALGCGTVDVDGGRLTQTLLETRAQVRAAREALQTETAALWAHADGVRQALTRLDESQARYNTEVGQPVEDPRTDHPHTYGEAERSELVRMGLPVLALVVLAGVAAARLGTGTDVLWVAAAGIAVVLAFVAVDQLRQATHLRALRQAQEAYDAAHEGRRMELEQMRLSIVGADGSLRDARATLRAALSDFATRVRLFEETVLEQPLFRPTVHPLRAGVGELVTVEAHVQDGSWATEERLIPEELTELARMEPGGASVATRFLVRRLADGTQSRRAVWFDDTTAEPTSTQADAAAVAEAIMERMRVAPAAGVVAPTTPADLDFSEIARPRTGEPHVYG